MTYQSIIDKGYIAMLSNIQEDLLFFNNGEEIDVPYVLENIILNYSSDVNYTSNGVRVIFEVIKHIGNYDALTFSYKMIMNYQDIGEKIGLDLFKKISTSEEAFYTVKRLDKLGFLTKANICKVIKSSKEKLQRFLDLMHFAELFSNIDDIECYKFLDSVIEDMAILKHLSFPFECSLEELKSVDFSRHFSLINNEFYRIEENINH